MNNNVLTANRAREERIQQLENPFSPIYTSSFIRAGVQSGKFSIEGHGLEKICTGCGHYWPADTEFFPWKGGFLDSWCRACRVEQARARSGKPVPGSKQGTLDL